MDTIVVVEDILDLLSIFKALLIDKDTRYKDVTIDLKEYHEKTDLIVISKLKTLQRGTNITFINDEHQLFSEKTLIAPG